MKTKFTTTSHYILIYSWLLFRENCWRQTHSIEIYINNTGLSIIAFPLQTQPRSHEDILWPLSRNIMAIMTLYINIIVNYYVKLLCYHFITYKPFRNLDNLIHSTLSPFTQLYTKLMSFWLYSQDIYE